MFGGEAVARRDADHVVLGDEEAEERDLGFRMHDAVAATVEHDEDWEAERSFGRQAGRIGFEDDDTRPEAIAHGDVGGRFEDVFGPAGVQGALEVRKAGGGECFEVRDSPRGARGQGVCIEHL